MTKDGGASNALLDERLLRLFDLLYETRSVTRAAERLGQAQPTVSIWLHRLRQELNDQLFVRTPSGMEPTPRAELLIDTARAAIANLQQLTGVAPSFDPATARRRFRICMSDASHITLLPQLLACIRREAPGVSVQALLIDGLTGERLQSGEADLALGLIPALGAGFFQQTLYAQDWVCLANPDHPRLHVALSRAEYVAESHVAIVPGTGQKLLEAAFAREGIQRRIVLELPGFLGLAAIVSNTDLIATLPRHFGETLAHANGLQVFPSPIPIASFTVKQHWHGRYHQDEASRWLRTACARLFQNRDPRRVSS